MWLDFLLKKKRKQGNDESGEQNVEFEKVRWTFWV